MITTHQYLDIYPVLKNSRKLIVGTIHPHDHANFNIPFFYGNVTSLWNIISDAFPEELPKPITLSGILNFLCVRKISMSDTIRKCKRTTKSALDQDLEPLELNHQILEDIRNSNITEVLFTSGFKKNNAFKLFFVDILGKPLTTKIRQEKEVILKEEVFGRPVKLSVLHSPSGSSNVGLSKNRQYLTEIDKYKNSHRPVYDFKVDFYRNKLS